MQMGIVGVTPYGADHVRRLSAGPTRAARVRSSGRRAACQLSAAACGRAPARACAWGRLRVRRHRRDPRALRRSCAPMRESQPRCGRHAARGVRVHRRLAADTYYGVLPRAKSWEAAALAARPLPQTGDVGAAGLIWSGDGSSRRTGCGVRCTRGSTSARRRARRSSPRRTGRSRRGSGSVATASSRARTVELHDPLRPSVPCARADGRARWRGQRIGLVGCTGHCFGPHVQVHLAGHGATTSATSTR